MRKSAQIAKVTAFLCALRAELGLVLLRVVERFDPVVSLGAVRPLRALVSLCILAHLRGVGAQGTSLVLLVVVEALFLIVTSLASARLSLEESKIEQNNTVLVLTLTLALCLAGSRRGCGWTVSVSRRARRSGAFGRGRRLKRVISSRIVIVAAGIVSF